MAPDPFSGDRLADEADPSEQETHDAKPVSNGFAPIIPSQTMTVLGIYGRAPIPRKDELPPNYKAKHLGKDQIFCRRRLNTKSLFDAEEEEKDAGEAANGESQINPSDPAAEDCPADEMIADITRVNSSGEGYENALFIPAHGLVGSTFFHSDEMEGHSGRPILEERAILFQSMEHYSKLMSTPGIAVYVLPQKLLDADGEEGDEHTRFNESNDEHIELVLDSPTFGEQVIVRGVEGSSISVGDIFEVEGQLSPLVVEVTSPRLPCSHVDRKHKSPFGLKGMRRYCMTNALSGWFTRVLVAGELRPGMVLTRTAHPYPKWTMTEISKALYAEGDKKKLARSTAHWERSIEELKELCQLEPLGQYEWKEPAMNLLRKMEADLAKQKEKELEAKNVEEEGDGLKKRETLDEDDDSGFFRRISRSFSDVCDVWCSAQELLFFDCGEKSEEVVA